MSGEMFKVRKRVRGEMQWVEVHVRQDVIDAVKENDLEWFLMERWTLSMARDFIMKKLDCGKSDATTAIIRAIADRHCQWWRRWRLKSHNCGPALTGEQWDKKRCAAEVLLPLMHGRSIRECVRLVRTKVSVNECVLRGLPKRFHVWN